MAELEGAREGDPVEEEWSVERVLDKRVRRLSFGSCLCLVLCACLSNLAHVLVKLFKTL